MLKHTGHAGTRFNVFPVSATGLHPANMDKKTASTKNLHDSTCCLNSNETHPLPNRPTDGRNEDQPRIFSCI